MAQIRIQPSVNAREKIAVIFAKMTRVARSAGGSEARTQANNIADEMRALSPVLTGAMQADISVQTQVNNNREIILTVGPHNTHYAKFVEFGTVNMRAQPFMRVAIELHKRDAVREITNAIREEVRQSI